MAISRNWDYLFRWGACPKRVKTAAYLHARDGQYSSEIDLLNVIDRFGVEAATGQRVLYFGQLRRLIAAEHIVIAYRARQASKIWAAWENDNEYMAQELADIEKQLSEIE